MDFVLANSADLMKCRIKWHFIWVFTVCYSTLLGVSGLQRVKDKFTVLFNLEGGMGPMAPIFIKWLHAI